MRSWRALAAAVIVLLPLHSSLAQTNHNFMQMDGMTFTGGLWGDSTNRRGWRIAPRWNWDVKWFQEYPVTITGYWEAGVGDWNAFAHHDNGNEQLLIFSGSEIFQFWFGPADLKRNALFLEFGIGPAYLTENQLGKRDLGGNWHFEDKFGAGLNFDTQRPFQLIYRYYHYSNAGFEQPNNGLDIHTLAFVCFF